MNLRIPDGAADRGEADQRPRRAIAKQLRRQQVNPEQERQTFEKDRCLEQDQHVLDAQQPTDHRHQVIGRADEVELRDVTLHAVGLVGQPMGNALTGVEAAVEVGDARPLDADDVVRHHTGAVVLLVQVIVHG